MHYVNVLDRKTKSDTLALNKKEKLINILSCIKRIDIEQVKKLVNYDIATERQNTEEVLIKRISTRR